MGEEAKRMKLKFEIVEVHFNFTSHDSVYFKKLVINFNFPAWARTPPKHNMSPSCHHPKVNLSFFWSILVLIRLLKPARSYQITIAVG